MARPKKKTTSTIEQKTEEILIENTVKEVVEEKIEEKSVKKTVKNEPQTKECKVMNYSPILKMLFVSFDGYGLVIRNVKCKPDVDSVMIKYSGEIGKSDFKFGLAK